MQVTSQVFYVGSNKKRDFDELESEEVVTEFLVDADGNQKEVYAVPVGIRGAKTLNTPGTTTDTSLGFGTINLGTFFLSFIAICSKFLLRFFD